jgi:hypothetical protein
MCDKYDSEEIADMEDRTEVSDKEELEETAETRMRGVVRDIRYGGYV